MKCKKKSVFFFQDSSTLWQPSRTFLPRRKAEFHDLPPFIVNIIPPSHITGDSYCCGLVVLPLITTLINEVENLVKKGKTSAQLREKHLISTRRRSGS